MAPTPNPAVAATRLVTGHWPVVRWSRSIFLCWIRNLTRVAFDIIVIVVVVFVVVAVAVVVDWRHSIKQTFPVYILLPQALLSNKIHTPFPDHNNCRKKQKQQRLFKLFVVVSSDRSSIRDDGLLYIQARFWYFSLNIFVESERDWFSFWLTMR